ncbi:hypothetical protein Pelo_10349 [Pelomyxa schiedti]|nr:hypothetical protein Pelo_10349 [Pelomyxa schiedti]
MNPNSYQIHRLHFWLQEIAQGHMQANVCGRAQIIIVAYSPFKDFDLHKPVNELLEPILQSPIWKTNLTLRGVYSLNYSMTSASFSETAPFICQRGVSVGTPAASICELLETIVSTASSTPVSPRWINLAHRLSKVRECVIKWTVFVQMALFFGVGAPLGGGRNPEVDIQMCCDFLSDTGAIIHFRHPCWSKSQRDLSQFVVLKLEWFNQIINDLADSIQSTRSSNSSILAVNDKEESPSNERATESTHFFQHLRELPSYSPLLLSLLRELNIVFLCENVPYLSYSLPTGASDSGLNFINAFWGGIYAIKPSKRSQVIFNGRSIDIGCTHDELSRKIMNILRQVPRLTQQFVGDSRIWVSKKSEGISQDVLVAFPDKLPIDIFMRTTLEIAENGDTPIGHAQNLGAYIIMWIRQFCETNNLPVHELFPCPHCLKLQIEHSTMPNIHYFKSSDVFDTTLSGNTSLKCPNQEAIDAPVNLTHVAPELSFLKIDKIGTSELPCDTPPGMVITKENENSASECYQLIEAGRRVSTTAERVMPLISVLREIPKHSRVVNYIGARYSNGRYFMTVTEPFPPTIPPRFTEEILGIQRKGSPLNLRDLIKFCMDRPKAIGLKPNLTSFIDQVLPMSLRAKILRDVAKGLALLHSQHPPLIHGGFLLEAG